MPDIQNMEGMSNGSSKLGWWTRTFDPVIATFGSFDTYFAVLVLEQPLYDGPDALIPEELSEHL